MRLRSMLIVAALTATALLAIAASGASARNLSTNERNFELIWNELLGTPKTKLEFIARTNNINIQCRVTFLGRFRERTIKKETATDQGTINHGELEACENATATIKTETMPWGLRYRSFTGTLPIIESITTGIIGARFKVREPGGLTCEFGSEVNHPLVSILGSSIEAAETGLERTGEPLNITAERGSRIQLGGEFLCSFAGELEFGGIGLITTLPRTSEVHISLI